MKQLFWAAFVKNRLLKHVEYDYPTGLFLYCDPNYRKISLVQLFAEKDYYSN